jgi:hypothetical protein
VLGKKIKGGLMKKVLVLVVLVVVTAVYCSLGYSAPSGTGIKLGGKLGLGYTVSDAPLGVKYWMSDSFGMDLGFGVTTGNAAKNFAVQVGADIVLANNDPVLLQFRGAMGFDTGAATNLYWTPALKVEYFVAKNLSVNVCMGLLLWLQVSPVSAFTFSHNVGSTGNLGIYYYF